METYIEKNGIPVIYAQTPWHFKNKEKQGFSAELTLQRNEKVETNGVLFDYRVYNDEKNHISGKRAVVKCGESAVFIVDVINSDEDICVYTDFSVCNTDYNVSCNVADKKQACAEK